MTSSEYRYHIERTYAESLNINDWLISDEEFQNFVLMAKTSGSGSLVLDNWKIYLCGGGDSKDFYEWWCEYRPDKLDNPVVVEVVDQKKSPFAAVKKRVRIE